MQTAFCSYQERTKESGSSFTEHPNSVVNSILDSCDAEKVQISVDGSMDGNFQESLPLYKFYEKNEDLIAQDDKKES